jgi:midasin (ATPase involved in ribosome maturation)
MSKKEKLENIIKELYFHNNKSKYIPGEKAEKYYGTNIADILEAIKTGYPILLSGETGTGKTSLVRYLAKLTNHGFRRVNHSGGTTTDDIVGKILVNSNGTYWVDGVLIDAMRNGDWYLADEINASSADILFIYHSLLDDDGYIVLSEKDGEIVKPHPEFRFFATINPSTDYHGTKEMNKALLSRFIVFDIDYPSPIIEAKIIAERTGIDIEEAKKMVKFASEVRLIKKDDKISYVLSTRDLIMWGKFYGIFKKFIKSAEISILNKINQCERESVKDLILLHFKQIDFKDSEDKKDEDKKEEENNNNQDN